MPGTSSQSATGRSAEKSPEQEGEAFLCCTARRTRPVCGMRCAAPAYESSNSGLILKEAKWYLTLFPAMAGLLITIAATITKMGSPYVLQFRNISDDQERAPGFVTARHRSN